MHLFGTYDPQVRCTNARADARDSYLVVVTEETR